MAEKSASKNRWNEALDYASSALDLAPACADVYMVLADYLLKEQKEPLFAICAAEKAMRDGSRVEDALRKALAIKELTRNPEEELYRYMLDHRGETEKDILPEPEFPIAYLVLKSEGMAIEGKCQAPGGEFKEAAALFGRAEGDDDIIKALKNLFAACERRPNVAQTYNLIGACYRHLGKPGMAISFFRQALSLNPAYDYALTNMGLCCQEIGLMKSAEYYFEQEAVRKSPSPWVRGRYEKRFKGSRFNG